MTTHWPIAVPISYQAYGTRILSEIPLPELSPAPSEGAGEVTTIDYGTVPLPEGVSGQTAWFHFAEDHTLFHWRDVGSFLVSENGQRITVAPAPEVEANLIAFPLLGPVLSDCLRRRGLFVLHASAVSLDGKAVALMADKGSGKSTTASSLLESGAALLADDLVAVCPDSMQVLPGFGQIKLSDAALNRLRLPGAEARPHVHAAIDKTRVLIADHFADGPVPLHRAYALERDPTAQNPRVELIPDADLLPVILRYAYAARFGRQGLSGTAAAEHFRGAVALAQSRTVRRLIVPEDLTRLGEIVQTIKDDLALAPSPLTTIGTKR